MELLLLLLSHFSHVQLCATPETVAYQTPLSLGFSRQEHRSGLPFPSPMHESEKWNWSRSFVSDSSQSHGLQPTRLLRPGKSTGVGCHCLLRTWNWSVSFYRDGASDNTKKRKFWSVHPLRKNRRVGDIQWRYICSRAAESLQKDEELARWSLREDGNSRQMSLWLILNHLNS